MTIKLDKSPVSVVVTCTECPWWSAFALTREAARESANLHERQVHPRSTQASSMRANARRRAEESAA